VKVATKRRITEAGRAELARTGALNLPHAREVRHQRQETTMQASIRFQSGLSAEIGKTSASREALIVSATTSYTALFAVLDRLRTARNAKQIAALIDLLRPLQSGLLRSLQALGITTPDPSDDDYAPADGEPRTLAEWTARWQDKQAAQEQTATEATPNGDA
jgi:hypothetical protein